MTLTVLHIFAIPTCSDRLICRYITLQYKVKRLPKPETQLSTCGKHVTTWLWGSAFECIYAGNIQMKSCEASKFSCMYKQQKDIRVKTCISSTWRPLAYMRLCCLSSEIQGKIATWLILPVVIRSSQRLSHACLSKNTLLWNCEWLIISVIVYLIVPHYLE